MREELLKFRQSGQGELYSADKFKIHLLKARNPNYYRIALDCPKCLGGIKSAETRLETDRSFSSGEQDSGSFCCEFGLDFFVYAQQQRLPTGLFPGIDNVVDFLGNLVKPHLFF